MYTVLPESTKTEKMPIYPVTIGVRRHQKFISRPQGANFNHILYVSSGEGIFDFNGERKILKAGCAVFLRKGIPVHYGPSGEDFKTSWITFDGKGGEDILGYFSAEDFAVITSPDVELKISEIYELCDRGAPYEMLSSKTYALLVDFFLSLRKANEPPILEKTKLFISENYERDLSVPEIAKKMGVSASLLFKLFREEENSTPMEFLKEVRIQRACNMLLDEEIKISEIATACGFSDASYFCKNFKERIGTSPASYRRKMT